MRPLGQIPPSIDQPLDQPVLPRLRDGGVSFGPMSRAGKGPLETTAVRAIGDPNDPFEWTDGAKPATFAL